MVCLVFVARLINVLCGLSSLDAAEEDKICHPPCNGRATRHMTAFVIKALYSVQMLFGASGTDSSKETGWPNAKHG